MSKSTAANVLPRIKLMCYECNSEFTARDDRCWKLWDDNALRPMCRACKADQEKEYKEPSNGPWSITLALVKTASAAADSDDKAIAKEIEDQVSAANGDGNKSDRPYFPPGTR